MSRAVENTLAGQSRGKNTALGFLFKPKTILALVLIGIFSFAALIALAGYAGDLRKDPSGRATPNSLSAIGYAGYVQLLKDMGYEVDLPANIAPPIRGWETRPLRIYTLANTYQSETIKDLPEDEAKLIILPKWSTQPKPDKAGWVNKSNKNKTILDILLTKLLKDAGLDLEITQAQKSDNGTDYEIKFGALDAPLSENDYADDDDVEYVSENYDAYTINSPIDYLQSFDLMEGSQEQEVILMAGERPILVRLPRSQTYILSEPDIFNTHGIATQSRARLAVNILDVIANYEDLTPQAADFDLSIHGLGGGRNIIKLMTKPPFLAATLCLLAAGGIIAWQAFSRFGDPQRRDPDFAQGPVSLAKSAAEFMSVSGRVEHMAPDYAQLTRQQVVRSMGLLGQSQDSINRIIQARETQRKVSPSFAELNKATNQKNTNLIEHARAMTRWKEEMIS